MDRRVLECGRVDPQEIFKENRRVFVTSKRDVKSTAGVYPKEAVKARPVEEDELARPLYPVPAVTGIVDALLLRVKEAPHGVVVFFPAGCILCEELIGYLTEVIDQSRDIMLYDAVGEDQLLVDVKEMALAEVKEGVETLQEGINSTQNTLGDKKKEE